MDWGSPDALAAALAARPGGRVCLAAGAGERDALVLETLLAFRRAGCSGVLTYHAAHAARLLGGR